MVTLLAKLWIKDGQEQDPARIRRIYGTLCGALGIVLNILLFLGKFIAGTLSQSIAITADAFNNLSDAGSSLVTLIGFYLAGAKPDTEHPFGHGRIEYLSGLVVSAAILIMAAELIRNSFYKILHPKATEFSLLAVVILAVSIAVKLYMACYNRAVGKKISSAAMKATATDSISDAAATGVVFAATLIGHFSGFFIDGYCGVLVGLFILYAGISAAKDTLNPLLGQPPDPEFVEQIAKIVLEHKDTVIGLHDLIVHDYGPGRILISLHAEVDARGNILELHDAIDLIEAELRKKLGCEAVIHMDPIVTDDRETVRLRKETARIVKEIDEALSMHDFRIVPGNTHTNLIFDIVVPVSFRLTGEETVSEIQSQITRQIGETYFAVVQVDKAYVINE